MKRIYQAWGERLLKYRQLTRFLVKRLSNFNYTHQKVICKPRESVCTRNTESELLLEIVAG